ncbi:MAG TPA: M50 family metallopeptidase [Holophagaceae bacterium]|nr:M50 family metallopeptidase [Holophagaceae bacterium]
MTELISLVPMGGPLGLLLPAKLMNFGLAFLGIGGLIFLHELGHFLVARWMGMPVETFSLGFGPRLVGFKWRETDVRLSALPLGGYVKLEGFNPEEPGAEDPHGFLQQPYWKRMLFYSGGILANLAVALALFTFVGVGQSRVTARTPKPSPLFLDKVMPGGAADKGGLKPADEILQMGDLAFPPGTSEQAQTYIRARGGQSVPLRVRREGRELALAVTPVAQDGKVMIGIQFIPTAFDEVRRPFQIGDLGVGLRYGVERMGELSGLIFHFLKRLVTFKASSGEVGGPIAITQQMSQAASQGLEAFLFFCAAISIQLAVLNALPIPMLDGGHMAVLSVERLRRRDFSLDFKEKLFTGGFLLLASLMAIVIFLDVMKLRK